MADQNVFVVVVKEVNRKKFDENRVQKEVRNFCRLCFGKGNAVGWAQANGGEMVSNKDKNQMRFDSCDGVKPLVVFHKNDWEHESWSAVFKVEEDDMDGSQRFGFAQDFVVQEDMFESDMKDDMRDLSQFDSFEEDEDV